jgi:hypothetical protein
MLAASCLFDQLKVEPTFLEVVQSTVVGKELLSRTRNENGKLVTRRAAWPKHDLYRQWKKRVMCRLSPEYKALQSRGMMQRDITREFALERELNPALCVEARAEKELGRQFRAVRRDAVRGLLEEFAGVFGVDAAQMKAAGADKFLAAVRLANAGMEAQFKTSCAAIKRDSLLECETDSEVVRMCRGLVLQLLPFLRRLDQLQCGGERFWDFPELVGQLGSLLLPFFTFAEIRCWLELLLWFDDGESTFRATEYMFHLWDIEQLPVLHDAIASFVIALNMDLKHGNWPQLPSWCVARSRSTMDLPGILCNFYREMIFMNPANEERWLEILLVMIDSLNPPYPEKGQMGSDSFEPLVNLRDSVVGEASRFVFIHHGIQRFVGLAFARDGALTGEAGTLLELLKSTGDPPLPDYSYFMEIFQGPTAGFFHDSVPQEEVDAAINRAQERHALEAKEYLDSFKERPAEEMKKLLDTVIEEEKKILDLLSRWKCKEPPEKFCHYCGDATRHKCAQCGLRYCSTKCQKAAWSVHRVLCKKIEDGICLGKSNE